MDFPSSSLAFRFLLPVALAVPLCAWAGFRCAAHPRQRWAMAVLIVLLLVFGSAWLLVDELGVGLSPGEQDRFFYNDFYWQQLPMLPMLALGAAALGVAACYGTLSGGGALLALGAALPALWWGASRSNAAYGHESAGPLAVALLGALAGALATLLPEPPGRGRRLVLWPGAGAAGAVGGLLLGRPLVGSSWTTTPDAAAPVPATLLLIAELAIAGLILGALLAVSRWLGRPANRPRRYSHAPADATRPGLGPMQRVWICLLCQQCHVGLLAGGWHEWGANSTGRMR